MASASSPHVKPSREQRLSEIFGSFKAEWLRGRLYDLFTAPSYFPELAIARPCVLQGARGTGKTTVLRGLSYEGQFELCARDPQKITDWDFIGLYYRVNTNRVSALQGADVPKQQWVRLFAHYFNLICCDQALRFVHWYEKTTASHLEFSAHEIALIAKSLRLAPAEALSALSASVRSALIDFEAYVNNIVDESAPPLSMQGAPIDALMQVLIDKPQFKDKHFFFLIDEYENLTDYQQQVVNTLIKHCGELYTFKIGVRQLGWRNKTTISETEHLISPADYALIDIAERLKDGIFTEFATDVCRHRLSRLAAETNDAEPMLSDVLRGITEEDEAERLGIRSVIEESCKANNVSPEVRAAIQRLPPLMAYLVLVWASAQKTSVEAQLHDLSLHGKKWQSRLVNYGHALLFTIRRGRTGIRKFYCGWDTYLHLAAGNIRYVLELVETALVMHLGDGRTLGSGVSPEVQTEAAQFVGRKNLAELEGVAAEGVQLTKLLLGLGRIFQVMAADAEGHAPEINQFHLADQQLDVSPASESETIRALDLLHAAVSHLALLRSTGTKPTGAAETRDYDYMVHPIFSAFFVFSYRRKRKMLLSGSDIIALIQQPKQAITSILARQNRSDEEDLPQQVLPFAPYYRAD